MTGLLRPSDIDRIASELAEAAEPFGLTVKYKVRVYDMDHRIVVFAENIPYALIWWNREHPPDYLSVRGTLDCPDEIWGMMRIVDERLNRLLADAYIERPLDKKILAGMVRYM